MTCIVGFIDKKSKNVWIGGDSLGSNGYTKATNLSSKVFRNSIFPEVIMGSTTTFRHIDLLKYSDNLFPEIDKYKGQDLNHEYMVKTFVPNLIKLFQDGIYSEEATCKGANFLIGCKDKLFEIQNDYSVLVPDLFSAVGCGQDVAIGSLISTTSLKCCENMEVQDHILTALRAATQRCCGVSGPYILLNTSTNEIYRYDN